MPILRQVDNPEYRKKLSLPSTQGLPEDQQAWVVMDTSPLLTADTIDFSRSVSEMQASVMVLARRIKEWNLTEADGTACDITLDNLVRLEMGDVRFLSSQIEKDVPVLSDEQKKTSLDTSAPSPTASTTTSVNIQSQ